MLLFTDLFGRLTDLYAAVFLPLSLRLKGTSNNLVIATFLSKEGCPVGLIPRYLPLLKIQSSTSHLLTVFDYPHA